MTWIGKSLAVAAAALAVHGAVWAYATMRLTAETDAGLDSLRHEGWIVAADAPQHGGWPLAATVRHREVLVDGTAAGVPVAWAADAVDLSLGLARPGTLLVVPAGGQRWRLGRADWVPVTAASLELAIGAADAGVAGRDVVLHLPGGPVEAAGLQADVAAQSLRLTLTGIKAAPLPGIDRAMLEAELTQPLPSGPNPAAAAAAWRDGGGAVRISSLVLDAGEFRMSAYGSAGLDAALQPVLNLTAQVRGYRVALDRLVQDGTIPASTAVAAKAVLGLLSGREPDAPATVPVRVEGGVASVAGFPLLRVPGIDWTAVTGR